LPEIGNLHICVRGRRRLFREPYRAQSERLWTNNVVVEIVADEHGLMRPRTDLVKGLLIDSRMRLQPSKFAGHHDSRKISSKSESLQRVADDPMMRVVRNDAEAHALGELRDDLCCAVNQLSFANDSLSERHDDVREVASPRLLHDAGELKRKRESIFKT